jgi:hypothetical protein
MRDLLNVDDHSDKREKIALATTRARIFSMREQEDIASWWI